MCRGVKSVPPWVNRVKVQIVMISSEATDISINWSKNAWDWSINSRPGPLLSSPCPRLVLLWPNCGYTAHWGRGWSACICFTHLLPPILCPKTLKEFKIEKTPRKLMFVLSAPRLELLHMEKKTERDESPFPTKEYNIKTTQQFLKNIARISKSYVSTWHFVFVFVFVFFLVWQSEICYRISAYCPHTMSGQLKPKKLKS